MQTIFFIQLFVNAIYIPLFINTPWKTTNALLFRSPTLRTLFFSTIPFVFYAERRTTALFVCMTLRPLFVVCTTAVHFNDFVWIFCLFVRYDLSLSLTLRWYFVGLVVVTAVKSCSRCVFFSSQHCAYNVCNLFFVNVLSYRLEQKVSQCAKAVDRTRSFCQIIPLEQK